MDETRDSAAFRMAIAGLGLGLAITLTGICVILAFGSGEIVKHGGHTAIRHDRHGSVPDRHRRDNAHAHSHTHSYSRTRSLPPNVPAELWVIAAGLFGALVGILLPTPRLEDPAGIVAAVSLALLAIVVLVVGISDSVLLQCVLATSSAAFVAIAIPTPARYDLG